LSSILHCGVRLTRGERADIGAAFLAPDSLDDMRQAVRRAPDDYPGIVVLALFELVAAAKGREANAPDKKGPDKPLDALAPDVREWLEGALKRLETGMEDTDHHRAAQAAEILGTLRLMLEEEAGAEACLSRAVALDPGRKQAWDLLSGCLTRHDRQDKYQENVRLCLRRLEHADSAHNRLMLARAYAWVEQFDRAEEQIRAALEKEPDDCLANIAMASLLMKHDNPADLVRAGEALQRAGSSRSPEPQGENRGINHAIACAVYYGLLGDVATARQRLDMVRKADPKNERAKEVLEALDE
jgi:Tfp pilus assembly protein PilF